MSERIEGIRYQETKDLDIKDVAKLVRKDLKDRFPDTKISVRIQRYSMGRSLHVVIEGTGISRGTSLHKILYEEIRDIVDAYNYDDSYFMTDYFDGRYYSHIRVEE